jgi:ribosomal protein L18E
LKKKLSVTAHAFSASAKSKIEGKGGSCEIVVAAKAQAAQPAPAAKPASEKPARSKSQPK